MNSAISPDESTRPGDSKTLLFVPDTPLRFGVRASEVWASEVRHYLEISVIPKLYFLYLTPPLGLELWASEVRHYLEISAK